MNGDGTGAGAPQSVFSGSTYGDGSNSTSGPNTTTSYKAGNGGPRKKKKKQVVGAGSVKTDGNKYSDGRQPDYVQASVFKMPKK